MRKNYFNLLSAGLAMMCMVFQTTESNAQGCVAVRFMAAGCASSQNASLAEAGKWQLNVGYRKLYSYKHYKGDSEQKERTDHYKDQVINDSHSADFTLSYAFNNKFSLGVSLPVSRTERSSKYEHEGRGVITKNELDASGNPIPDGKGGFKQIEDKNATYDFAINRHSTYSRGIGDMRIVGNFRLSNPEELANKDFVLGVGVKLPTGDYRVKGIFYKSKTTTLIRYVDQSMQLGDGGWGVIAEVSGYKKLKDKIFGYMNGFYLLNPRNTNGVGTGALTDGMPSAAQIADNAKWGNISEMSVPDQYMIRFGASFTNILVHNLSLTIGPRMEGVPRWDLAGKSDGFRRPGYAISAEPGITYMYNTHTISANVPYAIYRKRIKNSMDLKKPDAGSGTVYPSSFSSILTNGDAAFADYLVMLSYSYRF